MNLRPLVLLLATCPAGACTVLNSMDGYAGGARDTGTIAVDSTAPDTATTDTAQPDTTLPADTFETAAVDSAMDAADSAADSATVDTLDTAVVDTGDTGPCGAGYADFGLSEFQVRGTFGTGDKREWVEITNYGSVPLDVSGVVVKVFSGTERATFSIPAATTVPANGSVVLAGDKTTFSADVLASYGLGTVYDFGKVDYIVNSAASEVRLFAPGCTTPYEVAVMPSKMYAIGQPWAYPAPSATCPASARLTAGGVLGAAWKEVPVSTTAYGSYAIDGGMQQLYGTPTKPNNVACP